MSQATIAQAYVQLMPSFKGGAAEISKQLSGGMNEAGTQASSGFVKNFMQGVAQGVGQAAVHAITNAAKAAVDGTKQIIKSSLSEFGQFEQNLGGIETLFGKSANQMKQYAQAAYKTAGMSANEYMSQATSFAASLIQGLGGDSAKAAKAADAIMVAMSDNANKMGTDIGRITDAYQGFAKQNYTMLDNLKLGYGGTKTEMQRLLDDATKISGIKYELGNFADMAAAIGVIQTKLGITGTTALEAATTITGSLGMLKGAWMNTLANVGAATDSAAPKMYNTMHKMATNITDSLSSVIDNIGGFAVRIAKNLPVLAKELADNFHRVIWPKLKEVGAEVMSAFAEGMELAFPGITPKIEKLKDVLNQIKDHINGFSFGNKFNELKDLITPVISAFTPLGQILKGAAPSLLEVGSAFRDIGTTLGGAIKTILPVIADVFADLATTAIPVLAKILPTVAGAFKDLVTPLINAVTPLLQNEKLVKALLLAFAGHAIIGKTTSAINGLGKPLGSLAQKVIGLGTESAGPLAGLKGGLGAVKEAFGFLRGSDAGIMAGALGRFRDGFDDTRVAASTFSGVAGTLGGAAKTATTAVSNFGSAMSAKFVGLVKSATTAMRGFGAAMLANPIVLVVAVVAALAAGLVYFFTKTETGRAAWAAFTSWLTATWERVKEIALAVWGAITGFVEAATAKVREIWQAVTTWLTTTWASIKETAATVWNGIKDAIGAAVEFIRNIITTYITIVVTFWTNVWETIKAVLAGVLLTIVALLTGDTEKIKEIWSAVGAKLHEIWDETWNKVKEIFTAAKEALIAKFGEIKESVTTWLTDTKTAIVTEFTEALTFIKTWLSDTETAIVTKINEILTNIETWLSDLKNSIVTKTGEILDSIRTWLSNTKAAIESKFNEIVEWVKGIPAKLKAGLNTLTQMPEWFRGWVQDAKTAASNKFDEIVTFVSGIPGRTKAALGNLGSLLRDAGHQLIEGLKGGIADAAAGIAEAVLAPIRNAVAAAKRFLKIESPSRLMMEIGSYTAEGMQIGLEEGGGAIVQAATDIAQGIVTAIDPGLEVLGSVPLDPVFNPVIDAGWVAQANPNTTLDLAPSQFERGGHNLTFNTLAVSPRDVIRAVDLADLKARYV